MVWTTKAPDIDTGTAFCDNPQPCAWRAPVVLVRNGPGPCDFTPVVPVVPVVPGLADALATLDAPGLRSLMSVLSQRAGDLDEIDALTAEATELQLRLDGILARRDRLRAWVGR